MIKALIVEDSATLRDMLVNILSAHPDIEVLATASNGRQAVEAVARLKPDVVTMDIHMPYLNGFEATQAIMETHPLPIIVVSSTQSDDMVATFRSIEAGAVAFVRRPYGMTDPRYEESAAHLVQTVLLMTQVKVVRRWCKRTEIRKHAAPSVPLQAQPRDKIVAIGASTGGPVALQMIFSMLTKDFPLPIVVVQHMTPGFAQSFADWLGATSKLLIGVAADGIFPEPGHVYIAPDGAHMGVGAGGQIKLTAPPTGNGLCPSVSRLFQSIAENYGASAIAIILSGMGADGAVELKRLRDAGATTIAQNQESSVVHGMPGAAIATNGAAHVLAPDQIAALLLQLA